MLAQSRNISLTSKIFRVGLLKLREKEDGQKSERKLVMC
jgi:hypothetical protein